MDLSDKIGNFGWMKNHILEKIFLCP